MFSNKSGARDIIMRIGFWKTTFDQLVDDILTFLFLVIVFCKKENKRTWEKVELTWPEINMHKIKTDGF